MQSDLHTTGTMGTTRPNSYMYLRSHESCSEFCELDTMRSPWRHVARRLLGLLRSSPQVYGSQAVRRQTEDAEVDTRVLDISPAIQHHASVMRWGDPHILIIIRQRSGVQCTAKPVQKRTVHESRKG